MKKAILILVLLVSGIYSFAQCDRTVTYFSGKAEFLDSSGKVERSEAGKIVVKVSKKQITLMHNDDDNDTMEGTITDRICNWNQSLKNGKTTFTTQLVEKNGDSKNAFVSIEGKDGKLTLLVNIKSWGKTLKFVADSTIITD